MSESRNMETVPETKAQQTLTYNSQPREQRLWQPAERDPGAGAERARRPGLEERRVPHPLGPEGVVKRRKTHTPRGPQL